jgi:hypothetical protein
MGRKQKKKAGHERVEHITDASGNAQILIKAHEPAEPDKGPVFDINDVVGNMKPGSDKQSFSRIKRIYASGGFVNIEVDSTLIPGEHGGKPLVNQRLSVREAAERAAELNRMTRVMDAADRKMIFEIIANTIEACREAQQQLLAPPEKKIVVPGSQMPGR